jgi:hypothetical protein
MAFPHLVIVRFYEHIGPIDRGNRYEDPLQARLDEHKVGEVTGGGSQLNASGGIDYADVEITLADLVAAVDLVVTSLERFGAPEGSELIHDGRVLREFGTQQCLAIYLDGTSLPDEVYANLDFEQVVRDIGALAGPDSYHGAAQGAEDTGLMLFGPDADAMFARVEPLLKTLPIGQNARVVIREGRKGMNPRTTRMPRH